MMRRLKSMVLWFWLLASTRACAADATGTPRQDISTGTSAVMPRAEMYPAAWSSPQVSGEAVATPSKLMRREALLATETGEVGVPPDPTGHHVHIQPAADFQNPLHRWPEDEHEATGEPEHSKRRIAQGTALDAAPEQVLVQSIANVRRRPARGDSAEAINMQPLRHWDATTTPASSNTPKLVPVERRAVQYTTPEPVVEWTTAPWGWDPGETTQSHDRDKAYWAKQGSTTAAPELGKDAAASEDGEGPHDVVSTTQGSPRLPDGHTWPAEEPTAVDASGRSGEMRAVAEISLEATASLPDD